MRKATPTKPLLWLFDPCRGIPTTWVYERSAARYAAVRQSLGEPDPFRFKHKAALRQIVGGVVRGRMDRKAAAAFVAAWVEKNHTPEADRERFRDMAEAELVSLHEGDFARSRSGR